MEQNPVKINLKNNYNNNNNNMIIFDYFEIYIKIFNFY